MKHALTVTFATVIGIGLVAWYANRMISDRHTVGRYTFTFPANRFSAINGESVLNGMGLALQQSGMNPNAWVLSPSSEWQPTNALPKMNEKSTEALIVLSNQTERTELYVRVKLGATSNALEYHLYRPK